MRYASTREATAWVTMNYASSFIVKVTPAGQLTASDNSPECDDVLGEAADGSMWCQNGSASAQDVITRVNTDAAGGVNHPLPSDATYPNALAAGPVGSIWFTRSTSGTMFTSPSNGSVGYLDAATGATQVWKTGSRSAPTDLVMGPDGQMWFANVGAVPGIGHISANGVGAVSSVGSYEPHSLTFGSDGADLVHRPKNNSIVRVTADQLGTTNVDLGDGVTMLPTDADAGHPALSGSCRKAKGVGELRRGVLRGALSCPGGCWVRRAPSGSSSPRAKKAIATSAELHRPRRRQGQGRPSDPRRRCLRRIRPGTVVKVRVELTAPGRGRCGPSGSSRSADPEPSRTTPPVPPRP